MKKTDRVDRPLVEALERMRGKFGAAARDEKLRTLARCAERRPPAGRTAVSYHDVLLYMTAHPDDARISERAESELERIATAYGARGESSEPIDAGIAGSSLRYSFTQPAMSWLADRFPRSVELDLDGLQEIGPLGELFGRLVPPVERDGLDLEGLGVDAWIGLAKGTSGESDLAWLLSLAARREGGGELVQGLWDALDLELIWRLDDRVSSRTTARFPTHSPPHFHRRRVRRVRAKTLASRPLPRPTRLSEPERRQLLDVCRTAVYVRRRETAPLNHAECDDVVLYELERGVSVALVGMQPEKRPPLESFVGFVAAKNGVPVAYGGGWLFFDRCGIGINVFPEFRGGESGYVFAQVVRSFAQRFDARRFHVDPYQLGAGNGDAIKSGAFWFYYGLGFRPSGRDAAAVAAQEARLIADDRRHRTPARILRRLADEEMALQLAPREPSPEHTDVSRAVTAHIGRVFAGDRTRAIRAAARRARTALELDPPAGASEKGHFETWSLALSPLADLENWPAKEKEAFRRYVRAKAAADERTAVTALTRCRHLRRGLNRLVEREVDGSAPSL